MTPEKYRLAQSELLADGATGTRASPVAQEWLAPVRLRAVGDGIEWQPHDSLAHNGVIVPSEGLLDDFLALRDATPADVVSFAEVHGVLGLTQGRWYQLGQYAAEPLSVWREAAGRAYALVNAASRLRQGRPLTDDERTPVLAAAWPNEKPEATYSFVTSTGELATIPYDDEATALREHLLMLSGRTLEDDRTQLGWAVSTWMEETGARLVLAWPAGAGAPTVTIGGERAMGCLAAITVQVALACARADATRPCDGCGRLHAPRRQPKPGDRSFCQQCRDAGVPVKVAKRDSRARQRANREKADKS